MAVYLVPGVFGAGGQILDTNGKIATGALLTTYAAGTTSQVATFTTSAGTVTAANPVVCNADGRLPYELWQTQGQAIKITVTDALLNSLGVYDNLTGINDPNTASIISAATIAALKAIVVTSLPNNYTVEVLCYASIGDGGGGTFRWNSSSSAADNAGTIIIPNSAPATGRWYRVWTGDINTAFFNGDEAAALTLGAGTTAVDVPGGTVNKSSSLTIVDQQNVIGSGAMASVLSYSGTSYAYIMGDANSGLDYGMSLTRKRIITTASAGSGIIMRGCNGAVLRDVNMEGNPAFAGARSNVGITIDGEAASAFFNVVDNVNVSHMKVGLLINTFGAQVSTQQHITNFRFIGDSNGDESAIQIAANCGDGTTIYGGDLEACGIGLDSLADSSLVSLHGVRFESATITAKFGAGSQGAVFVACHGMTAITDNSNGTAKIECIGCTGVDGRPFNTPYMSAASSITLRRANSGRTIALDNLAGSTTTLPASTGSRDVFRFMITVVPTSNAIIIKVANSSDVMSGMIIEAGAVAGAVSCFSTAPASDTITLNRSTTGAVILGEWIELEDIAANVWAVKGMTTTTGAAGTPFSATV